MYCRSFNRKKIKKAQKKELLYVFYYLFYSLEFIIKLILTLNRPNVSFEKESRLHSKNPRYTEFRKPYKWIKYL